MGGAFGILLAAGVSSFFFAKLDAASLPWIIAPMGASAVLVFAIPASPLAQPWAVIGGNLLSALVGSAIGHTVALPVLAAALAVGLAIAAMTIARCLHPPGGACALLYALGEAGTPASTGLHLLVVLVNVMALATVAWLYNNLTGHRWPHRPLNLPGAITPGSRSAAVHQALTEVMAEWNEVIDADIDDLDAIFQAVERRIRSSEEDAPPAARI